MRKIKFRGKVCGLEKFVYGDLLNTAQPCIVPTKGNHSPIPVEEESVAQFVGYDTDGAEVYEGDTVRHFTGELVKVRLSGETDTYSYLGVAGEKFDDCRLEKE